MRIRGAARGTEDVSLQLPTDPGERLRVVSAVGAAPDRDDALVLAHAHSCTHDARLPDGFAHEGEEQLLPQTVELYLYRSGGRWHARRRTPILAVVGSALDAVQPAASARQGFLRWLKRTAKEVIVVARLELPRPRKVAVVPVGKKRARKEL